MEGGIDIIRMIKFLQRPYAIFSAGILLKSLQAYQNRFFLMVYAPSGLSGVTMGTEQQGGQNSCVLSAKTANYELAFSPTDDNDN
eukprot:417007-Prorocentrum_minimum.AAC.5